MFKPISALGFANILSIKFDCKAMGIPFSQRSLHATAVFPQCRFLYQGEHNAQDSGFAQITLLRQYCCKKAASLQTGAADVLQ